MTEASRTVRSMCQICAINCGILVTTDGERVLRIEPDPEHPLSQGYLCPKGRALQVSHHAAQKETTTCRCGSANASAMAARSAASVRIAIDSRIAHDARSRDAVVNALGCAMCGFAAPMAALHGGQQPGMFERPEGRRPWMAAVATRGRMPSVAIE